VITGHDMSLLVLAYYLRGFNHMVIIPRIEVKKMVLTKIASFLGPIKATMGKDCIKLKNKNVIYFRTKKEEARNPVGTAYTLYWFWEDGELTPDGPVKPKRKRGKNGKQRKTVR